MTRRCCIENNFISEVGIWLYIVVAQVLTRTVMEKVEIGVNLSVQLGHGSI